MACLELLLNFGEAIVLNNINQSIDPNNPFNNCFHQVGSHRLIYWLAIGGWSVASEQKSKSPLNEMAF